MMGKGEQAFPPTTFPSSQRLYDRSGWEATANGGFPARCSASLIQLAEPGIHVDLRLFGHKTVAVLEPGFELPAAAFDSI